MGSTDQLTPETVDPTNTIETTSFQKRRQRKKNEIKNALEAADPDHNDEDTSRDKQGLSVLKVDQSLSKRKMSLNPNAEVKTFDVDDVEHTEYPCIPVPSADKQKDKIDPKMIENALAEQEKRLREEFSQTLFQETESLKARFDYILQNEQIRASHMLREAYRDRKEKIAALQQQLECKNLAALMYVMCTERTKCKMEKLQLIETYTNYINMLNEVLSDGQELILNLSRGYKSAARIDFEWRSKMNKIIDQFLKYIYHYSGTPPEQNQFYFNLPALVTTESPIEDDPNEDPIESEDREPTELSDLPAYKSWWERLEDDPSIRPFVVYGDISNFPPNQRRETLKTVRAEKTAPQKWKEYIFNEMFLKSECPVADLVKHEYMSRIPDHGDKWECQGLNIMDDEIKDYNSRRRQTAASIDIRGNMGSILKIITTTAGVTEPVTKANLLGARDSMEIASTTKLRSRKSEAEKVEIKVGNRRTTQMYEDKSYLRELVSKLDTTISRQDNRTSVMEEISVSGVPFGSRKTSTGHIDSLEVIPKHIPEADHKINYEKVCPMPKCQRMHVDSFMRSLPHYMRENPFTHFEQTFDDYETCSPEQIEELQKRIAEKKQQERENNKNYIMPNPLLEWVSSVEGIGVQTLSDGNLKDLPPCTCRDPNPSVVSVYRPNASFAIKDLLPAKLKIDQVTRDCFWKDIDFNRFKVVGETDINDPRESLRKINAEFTRTRVQEIRKILKQNPSLLDLFQANTK